MDWHILVIFTKIEQMQESKRQKQVAAVLEHELNDIFHKLGLAMTHGGMVSISHIKVTPDLYEARVYLSFFKVDDPQSTLKTFEDRSWEIKKELTAKVRHQLRIMPKLSFYIDDTLEYVDKMEQLFKDIKKQDDAIRNEQSGS